MADSKSNHDGKGGGVLDAMPTDQLGDEFQRLLHALAGKVLSSAGDRVGGLTDKLSDFAENGGGGAGAKALAKAGEKTAEGKSPLMAGLSAGAEGIKSKVSEAFGGGGKDGKKGKKLKVTNIVEQIDIGAPVEVVYNQWTQFQDFSDFMKKVESVDQADEQKLNFKAQILWSHRSWNATILDQVPDKRIVWRSKGDKGHVDGAVTFHEIGPDLTRVLLVLEYHPQGLFERTGNLWRAQGRRVRLELKHFRRQVMMQAMLHPDELEGWRGEIHDSKVTKSHEDAQQERDDTDDEYDAAEKPATDDETEEEEDEDDEYDDETEDVDDEEEDEEDEEDEDSDVADDDLEDDVDDEDDGEPGDAPRRRSRTRSGRT